MVCEDCTFMSRLESSATTDVGRCRIAYSTCADSKQTTRGNNLPRFSIHASLKKKVAKEKEVSLVMVGERRFTLDSYISLEWC